MSQTYQIYCQDCRTHLWIAQGWSEADFFIFASDADLTALTSFLWTHQLHKLAFGDEEKLRIAGFKED